MGEIWNAQVTLVLASLLAKLLDTALSANESGSKLPHFRAVPA
jgi:hypothetical protein